MVAKIPQLMDGFRMYYKTKAGEQTKFNNKLFGRLHYSEKKGKRYTYYYPGLFDTVLYKKVGRGFLYLPEVPDGILDELAEYCHHLSIVEVKFLEGGLMTGREYWAKQAEKKNVLVKWFHLHPQEG